MSQRRIAILVAGMLVGAQVGIAAVDGSFSPPEEYAEPVAAAEAVEEVAALEQAPAPEATAGEQAAAAEHAAAVEAARIAPGAASDSGYIMPVQPRTLADATFPPLHSDVFPPSTDDRPLHPALVEYLDRKAATTLLADAGSREPVFPVGYDHELHPALVAYFERREAAQLAAAQSNPTAAQPPSSVNEASSAESAAVDPTAPISEARAF